MLKAKLSDRSRSQEKKESKNYLKNMFNIKKTLDDKKKPSFKYNNVVPEVKLTFGGLIPAQKSDHTDNVRLPFFIFQFFWSIIKIC